jgi:hypothetical protein
MVLFLAAGCGGVQRRITVRSNPPGAQVYIDKYEIGRTPCAVSFLYYGKREFKLVKDGCETLTVDKWIFPPWYEYYGLDFISENLSPVEIRDERTYDFQLIPMQVVGSQQLIGRGENLRQATRAEGLAIPAPTSSGAIPLPSQAKPPNAFPLPPGNFTLPPPGGSAPSNPLPPPNGYPTQGPGPR